MPDPALNLSILGVRYPHERMAVGPDIRDADIIAHDDKDVGLVCRNGSRRRAHHHQGGCRIHNTVLLVLVLIVRRR